MTLNVSADDSLNSSLITDEYEVAPNSDLLVKRRKKQKKILQPHNPSTQNTKVVETPTNLLAYPQQKAHTKRERKSSKKEFIVDHKDYFSRIHLQNILWAQELDNLKFLGIKVIMGSYGLLDALNLTCSTMRLLIDWYILFFPVAESAADLMHDILASPSGTIATAFICLSMMTLSIIANGKEDDKDGNITSLTRAIIIFWPYLRDILKSMKNSYKDIRVLVQLANLFGKNFFYLMGPLTLILAPLTAVNRMWIRYAGTQRQLLKKANDEQLKIIAALKSFKDFELWYAINGSTYIKTQPELLEHMGIIAALLNGIIDGIYIYVGVLSIAGAGLSFPVLIIMVALCAAYFLACVATKIYVEYEYQTEFKNSQTKLAFTVAHIKAYEALNRLSLSQKSGMDFEKEKNIFLQEVKALEKIRKEKEKMKYTPYIDALMFGMTNGLAAYGAVTSLMFGIATIYLLASVTFPPLIVAGCILLGLPLMLIFTFYPLITLYFKRSNDAPICKEEKEFVDKVAELTQLEEAQIPEFRSRLKQEAKATAKFSAIPYAELARIWGTVPSKSSRFIEFCCNKLMEQAGDLGHYQDTPIMYYLMMGSFLLHLLVLTLRGYVRSFSKDKSFPRSSPECILTKESYEASSPSSTELPPPVPEYTPDFYVIDDADHSAPEETATQKDNIHNLTIVPRPDGKPPKELPLPQEVPLSEKQLFETEQLPQEKSFPQVEPPPKIEQPSQEESLPQEPQVKTPANPVKNVLSSSTGALAHLGFFPPAPTKINPVAIPKPSPNNLAGGLM